MIRFPEAVITGAIGCWLAAQPQRIRRGDGDGWTGFAPPRQNVENDIGGMDTFCERRGAGCLHRGQAVDQHRAEDVHHLPVTVCSAA